METVPAPSQDSRSSSPIIVKGEDESSSQGSGRASPPPNCAICLGTCRNKSFTDSCLHQFCFKCLLTWSKVKAVCPLCKQIFRSIIHNVRSNHQYEEYMVGQQEDLNERVDIDGSRTFRYRTTLTLPRHESLAIQQLLLQHYPIMANVFPPPVRRRRSPSVFRRTVYRHNLWARPLPDFTGRFRDCTPEFYRYNETQIPRLIQWLNRELVYLLNENVGHIHYVLGRIMELLPQHHIKSRHFREVMQRYLGDRTRHFLHELYCFASTPYDMTGYDRNVQYTTDTRVSTIISEVISSSDSDTSLDSDIVMISSSAPADPPAGPSRVPAPVYPVNYIPDPTANNVIPIETLTNSDTDDDSEVMVVGYIKPPQDRTPEIVDLLGSDSDVIVQDTPLPETSQNSETSENRPVNLVKLSLKWLNNGTVTDSDDSNYVPPNQRRGRRRRNPHPSINSPLSRYTNPASTASMSSSRSSSSSSSDNAAVYTPPSQLACLLGPPILSDNATSMYSSDSNEEKSKVLKRKLIRKSSSERNKKRSKRSTSRSHRKESKASQSSSEKPSKRKSHSGKGVKSSKTSNDSAGSSKSSTEQQQAIDEPTASTSGASSSKKHKPHKVRRPSNESRRLRSVVQVMKSKKTTNAPRSSTGNRNVPYSVPTINSRRPENLASRPPIFPVPEINNPASQSSDSEDNLPLNLTIKKASQ